MSRLTLESGRIREIYDRCAPGYDRSGALAERVLWGRLRHKLLAWADGRVLEVGVGTGRTFVHYPEGCHITAIDLSAEMLKHAARRARRLGMEIELQPMDVQALHFPDRTFDTVVCNLALCTVADPIRALVEMARVARPSGRLLLLEHGRSNLPWLSALLDRWAGGAIRRAGCHPNRNVLALVQASDLVVLNCERHLMGMVYLIQARPPKAAKVFK